MFEVDGHSRDCRLAIITRGLLEKKISSVEFTDHLQQVQIDLILLTLIELVPLHENN